jgi:hypothetical protein
MQRMIADRFIVRTADRTSEQPHISVTTNSSGYASAGETTGT